MTNHSKSKNNKVCHRSYGALPGIILGGFLTFFLMTKLVPTVKDLHSEKYGFDEGKDYKYTMTVVLAGFAAAYSLFNMFVHAMHPAYTDLVYNTISFGVGGVKSLFNKDIKLKTNIGVEIDDKKKSKSTPNAGSLPEEDEDMEPEEGE